MSLPDAASILDRVSIDLEALAEFGELNRVGEELAVVVDDLVGEDRFPIVRRGTSERDDPQIP